jgi:hypothetical protein
MGGFSSGIGIAQTADKISRKSRTVPGFSGSSRKAASIVLAYSISLVDFGPLQRVGSPLPKPVDIGRTIVALPPRAVQFVR